MTLRQTAVFALLMLVAGATVAIEGTTVAIADDAEMTPAAPGPDRSAVQARAVGIFGSLPPEAENPENRVTPGKIELGRVLYYDPRLSKNHDISCNSCHQLDRFGVDN